MLEAPGTQEFSIEPQPGDCPACRRPRAPGPPALVGSDRLHGVSGRFAVARCTSCGAGWTLPRAAPNELAAFYPAGYGPYELPTNPLLRVASAAIRRWQRMLAWRGMPLGPLRNAPPGRAVDVGCGRGDLGAALIRRGWQVTGVEPSPQACAVARARGLDARCGTLAEVGLEAAGYDAATFQHSLEHVEDPLEDLRRTRAALRPGGLVLITVPNFGCWQRHRFGSRWFHLDLPRHRVHFTAQALRSVLERSGFEVLELRTATSAVGLPASVQYALAGRCLFPAGLPLRVASGLCALAQPLALVADRSAGAGDLLHAVARR